MTVRYSYIRNDGYESLTVVDEDLYRSIASTNPRFEAVRDYLFTTTANGEEVDREHVRSLIDAGPEAIAKIQKLSDRVTYFDNTLFFDGDEIDNKLSKHIVRMVQSGDENYKAFVNFLENVSTNPSKKSRKELFKFIQRVNLTITPEGHFIAYKGVDNEGLSLNSGQAIVNDKLVVGKIPNEIGSEIYMPRNDVDDNYQQACSTGLHVGTRSYASSYGTKMIIVSINPRDAVSVPRDGDGEKMRVCRYVVLDDNDHELEETTYGGSHRDLNDTDDFNDDWNEAEYDCEHCGSYFHSSVDCDDDEDDLCL